MNYITAIDIGWKRLRTILIEIVKNQNARTPLAGNGIAVSEYPNGVIIAIRDLQTEAEKEKDQGGPGWKRMAVIDDSSGTCVKKYIWYWGTAPTTNANASPPKTHPLSIKS